MAVPKRKQSQTRSRKRRTHDALDAPALSLCPKCKAPKSPHRACSSCGFYKDKRVLVVKEA